MEITEVYELDVNETLDDVATRYGMSREDLLFANQHIENPNEVWIGETLNIPALPIPAADALAAVSALAAGTYDGIHPAPGTISTNRAALIFPPLTNSPGNRSAAIYNQIINQFAVGHNPRYLPSGGATYCNIFLWDVTRAMGAEMPHWIKSNGDIALPFSAGAHELTINAGVVWLQNYGVPQHGWQLTDKAGAQNAANAGKPAVVVWKNPTGGHGHTAIVRPGVIDPNTGPTTAQAGARNFNEGHLTNGFGTITGYKFYIHA